MSMNSTGFPDSVRPGVKAIYDNTFEKLVPYRENMYTMLSTTQQSIRVTNTGDFREVPKFQSVVTKDTPFEGYGRDIVNEEYALQLDIQKRLFLTQQLPVVKQVIKKFARGVAATIEHHAMKPFNQAFSTGSDALLGDGQPLISAAHPNKDGTPAQDNRIGNGAPTVTHGTIKALHAQAQLLKNDRGRPERFNIDGLVFNPTKCVEFMEAINSTDDPTTPSRATNILAGNLFERIEGYPQTRIKLFSSPYLDNPYWWFGVNTRRMKDNLMWFTVQEPEFTKATELSTLEISHQVYMFHGNAPINWPWVYGSQATS